ncbi:MAG: hypothetical protein PUD81_00600 [Eggerthellales bacterium]|nr:hypothetical protein [Eggerthellales bacterium]
MAVQDEILKAAQGAFGAVKNVAANVADKVENVAESVTGKDLDNDGAVGSEASEKLVSDVKSATATAVELGKEAAGFVSEKAQVVAGVAAEKGKEAAGFVAEKAPVVAAAAVDAGKGLADKAGSAIQGVFKKNEVIEAENVEELPLVDPVADAAAAAVAAADEAAAAADEAAEAAVESVEEAVEAIASAAKEEE